jgi:voltage-gated potassium channel
VPRWRPLNRTTPSRWPGRLVASRVRLPFALLTIALVYGTVGYGVFFGFGFVDAVYMTVTTLTTVGFGEIEPLSTTGRVFTISLIALGVVAVFDLVAVFTGLLAGGQFTRFLERRAMQSRIAGLSDHYVICAYGRVGRAAALELADQGAPVVVIEVQGELEELINEADLPYVIGDPTEESVLEQAGIRRARALLCAVDSDAVNVYIVLTARALNPDLFIISRASSPQSLAKLQQAGSDRVVSPYLVSGVRMARMALQPAVVEFVDMVNMSPDLRIEELVVGKASRLAGRTVQEACAPYDGLMVLAVRSAAGELNVPPRAETRLGEDDLLIAVGPAKALAGLAVEAAKG